MEGIWLPGLPFLPLIIGGHPSLWSRYQMGLEVSQIYFSISVGEPGKGIIHKEGAVLKLDLVSSLHALV